MFKLIRNTVDFYCHIISFLAEPWGHHVSPDGRVSTENVRAPPLAEELLELAPAKSKKIKVYLIMRYTF